jgi:hypothetical protein
MIGTKCCAVAQLKCCIYHWFMPVGAQHIINCRWAHTIVCTNGRSAYHCLHQQALSIPLFVPTGAKHTIVRAKGRSAYHRLCQRALSISLFAPMGTYHCLCQRALKFFCHANEHSSEYCSRCQVHIIVQTQPSVLFQALHQPLGAKSKHCAASHWAQNQSIALPSGAISLHCAIVGHYFSALRHHLALIPSIAPPLGSSFKHCPNVWR